MGRINRADSTRLATASIPVGGSAHACLMALAVKNTVGKHRSLQTSTTPHSFVSKPLGICHIYPLYVTRLED